MENELRLWWSLSRELNHQKRAHPDSPDLGDFRDEAEVVIQHSDWPRLRRVVAERVSGITSKAAAVKALSALVVLEVFGQPAIDCLQGMNLLCGA